MTRSPLSFGSRGLCRSRAEALTDPVARHIPASSADLPQRRRPLESPVPAQSSRPNRRARRRVRAVRATAGSRRRNRPRESGWPKRRVRAVTAVRLHSGAGGRAPAVPGERARSRSSALWRPHHVESEAIERVERPVAMPARTGEGRSGSSPGRSPSASSRGGRPSGTRDRTAADAQPRSPSTTRRTGGSRPPRREARTPAPCRRRSEARQRRRPERHVAPDATSGPTAATTTARSGRRHHQTTAARAVTTPSRRSSPRRPKPSRGATWPGAVHATSPASVTTPTSPPAPEGADPQRADEPPARSTGAVTTDGTSGPTPRPSNDGPAAPPHQPSTSTSPSAPRHRADAPTNQANPSPHRPPTTRALAALSSRSTPSHPRSPPPSATPPTPRPQHRERLVEQAEAAFGAYERGRFQDALRPSSRSQTKPRASPRSGTGRPGRLPAADAGAKPAAPPEPLGR